MLLSVAVSASHPVAGRLRREPWGLHSSLTQRCSDPFEIASGVELGVDGGCFEQQGDGFVSASSGHQELCGVLGTYRKVWSQLSRPVSSYRSECQVRVAFDQSSALLRCTCRSSGGRSAGPLLKLVGDAGGELVPTGLCGEADEKHATAAMTVGVADVRRLDPRRFRDGEGAVDVAGRREELGLGTE